MTTTKHKITIEVDVPDGFELTGEFRIPKSREYFLRHNGTGWKEVWSSFSVVSGAPKIILREKWTPPAWLPDGVWVFKWGKQWFASKAEPDESLNYIGDYVSSCVISVDILQEWHRDSGETFTPPPVGKIQIDRRPKGTA